MSIIKSIRNLLKSKEKTKNKRPFSLLEIVIALILLVMMSGVVAVRVGHGLEKRRFETAVNRLRFELDAARRLSLNMQVDWVLLFEKRESSFALKRTCLDTDQVFFSEWQSSCKILFNQHEENRITFHFASSGKVSPSGTLTFMKGKNQIEWDLSQLFNQIEE